MVRAAVFELAKGTPADVVPEIDTLYPVGAASEIEAGTVKLTRRVEPTTVVTAVAAVFTGTPPPVGLRLTVVLVPVIVPVGNPDPVTLTLVTPGCAVEGEAADVNVTADVC